MSLNFKYFLAKTYHKKIECLWMFEKKFSTARSKAFKIFRKTTVIGKCGYYFAKWHLKKALKELR